MKSLLIVLLIMSVSFSEVIDKKTQVKEYVNSHVKDSDQIHFLGLINLDFSEVDLSFSLFGNQVDMTPSLHKFFLLFNTIMILFFLLLLGQPKNSKGIPSGFSNVIESMVEFVRDICISNMGNEGKKYVSFHLTLFILILVSNYIGLIPTAATPTANINFTGALAFLVLVMMFVVGIRHNGIKGFMSSFMPSGFPWWMKITLGPFIYVIEFLSMFIRSFALSVRLFANMLSGHLVILSLVGLIITFGVFGVPSIFLILFMYVLKVLICFLHAYIFVLLSSIFLGLAIHTH